MRFRGPKTKEQAFRHYENAFKKLGADPSEKQIAWFKRCTRFVPTQRRYQGGAGDTYKEYSTWKR